MVRSTWLWLENAAARRWVSDVAIYSSVRFESLADVAAAHRVGPLSATSGPSCGREHIRFKRLVCPGPRLGFVLGAGPTFDLRPEPGFRLSIGTGFGRPLKPRLKRTACLPAVVRSDRVVSPRKHAKRAAIGGGRKCDPLKPTTITDRLHAALTVFTQGKR